MYQIGGRRVVLTGGACQLPGIQDMAALILDRKIRIGRPLGIGGLADSTAGPAHAVAAGLIRYAVESERTVEPQPAAQPVVQPSGGGAEEGAALPGFVGRLGTWFREHF